MDASPVAGYPAHTLPPWHRDLPGTASAGFRSPYRGESRRVAAEARCCWRDSDGALKRALTIASFDQLGVPRLS